MGICTVRLHSGPMTQDPTGNPGGDPTGDPATADTSTGAPPPPPGSPATPRPLRRSNTERMVAGVCGGTAEYFGIDPIIVRLGFVALALLGGSGVLLYLIAWLVMPGATEDESAALNALRGGHRPGGRSLLALGLLIIGIIVLSGSALWAPSFRDGLFLPLLILAAGIALLVWPSDGPRWSSRLRMDHDEWRDERRAVRDEWRRERDEWRASRQQWHHGYQRGLTPDDPPTEGTHPGALPPPPRPPHRPRPPRPRPLLGPLAIALLLLYSGLSVFADRVGWWSTDPGSFVAVCLMIVGGVLVLSAFLGRARGLIWIGVLLLPIAWAITAIDLTWWDGVGERTVAVTTIDQLDDSYRWGIGEFTVDLSDLDLGGNDRDLAVGLTIGELTVYVPETMGVEIDLVARMGSVIITDGQDRVNNDGIDITLDRVVGDPDGGTLRLDVDMGIGEAEIVVCGGEGVACP
jgi:phage shock protein PspC (stress-responsive transcriptional regulator)